MNQPSAPYFTAFNLAVGRGARTLCAIDFRTLALVRVALGLLLLWDLAVRSTRLTMLYTNAGVLPNHFNLFHPSSQGLSILNAFSSPWEVRIVFFLFGIVFLAFTLGTGGAWIRFLTLACSVSLTIRNTLIENGGHLVLCVLLTWSILLPLDRYFSLTAWRRQQRTAEPWAPFDGSAGEHVSIAGFGALWSLALIYFFNALTKTGPTWWDGTALHYALNLSPHNTWMAHWLRANLPVKISEYLSYGALWSEAALGPLILLPMLPKLFRALAVLLIFVLHGGIGAILVLGVFPVVLPVYGLLLVHRTHWEWCFTTTAAPRSSTKSCSVRSWTNIKWASNSALSVLLIVCVTLQSWAEYTTFARVRSPYVAPQWTTQVTEYLRILQHWRMFAPNVPKQDYAVVLEGELADGAHIDLHSGAPFDRSNLEHLHSYFDRPQNLDSYELHWQLRTLFSFFRSHPDSLRYYGEYLATQHPTVRRLWILHLERDTPPPGGQKSRAIRRYTLAEFEPGGPIRYFRDVQMIEPPPPE
jgi:hypothetical protein